MVALGTLLSASLVLALSCFWTPAQAGALADYMIDYARITERLKLEPRPGVFQPLQTQPHKELLRVTAFFRNWAFAKELGPSMMKFVVHWSLDGQLERLLATAKADIEGPLHHQNVVFQDPQTLLAHWQRWSQLDQRYRALQWSAEQWERLELFAGEDRYQKFRTAWSYAVNMDYLLEQAYHVALIHRGKPGK